jgi:hypothetical protein
MVQITADAAFLFFGAIILGAMVGLAANIMSESAFQYSEWCRRNSMLIFIMALCTFCFLVGVSLLYFNILATASNQEGPSCCCNNSTNNYYTYNISQIIIDDNKSDIIIPEFKNIFRSEEYLIRSRLT